MLFEQLKEESAAILESYATLPFIVAVRAGTVSAERYRQFLNDLYHVVWHFCPTMAVGASRCADDYSVVRYALYEHIEDEKGHELWVLDDCRDIGGEEFVEQVKKGLPRPEIQAMNAFNYHVAERQHGAIAFAMVFALEMISQRLGSQVSKGVAKALKLAEGQGTRFLSSHGPMDADHLVEISGAINSISDPKVAKLMSNAVMVNYRLFAAMLS
ncbi:MAG TPA: iron-containing redox enzyme family protein [Noviherbaspirillum sp.]